MLARVVYYSKTGNTKKLAEVFAGELGCKAESCEEAEAKGPLDVLMLGGAVYATYDHKHHPSLVAYIKKLRNEDIKKVIVFGTYAFGSSLSLLIDLIKAEGLPVEREHFECKGRFLFFNRKSPNKADLENAQAFIRTLT